MKARKSRIPERPLGITVISILNWIGAAVQFVGGVFLLSFGGFMSFMPMMGGLFGPASQITGLVFMLLGLVTGIVTKWLWDMERRGWTWVVIFNGVSFVASLFSLNFVSTVISGMIVFYLWTKKEEFR
ncbi:MAG: hypothetical protein HY833_02065 [Candidatus Aenigmarchaeota archaeon]|nr:hypothetical protein [Candidatus Aenigmarchaeota archaeon]